MDQVEREVIGPCPNPKCGKPVWNDHSDPWCHHCGEHFPGDFAERLPRLVAGRAARYRPTLANDQAAGGGTKQTGIVTAIIGGLLFLFGLVRFNSMESQVVRGLGGSDNFGVLLLIAGGALVTGGALMAFLLTSTDPPSVNSEMVHSSKHSGNSNSIEELERLAALRERGVLSDEEFAQQKRKILG